MLSTVFTSSSEISYKYTAVPDYRSLGILTKQDSMNMGFYFATVSASANDKIQKRDPYVKDGLAESGLTSIVLPSVKTAREGRLNSLLKSSKKKALQKRRNIAFIADKEGVCIWNPIWPICSDSSQRKRFCGLSKYLLLVCICGYRTHDRFKDLESRQRQPRKWTENSTASQPIILLARSDRSGLVGIKSLDPSLLLNMTMDSFFMPNRSGKLTSATWPNATFLWQPNINHRIKWSWMEKAFRKRRVWCGL